LKNWLFNMEWDQALLRLINLEWQLPIFDRVMPFLRNAETWVPLYLFLILLVLLNYQKTGWWWLLAAVSTPILTDLLSSWVIKENFFRLRPCNEPILSEWLRMLPGIYHPQSSSFTSSHAANHFGLAIFIFMTLQQVIGRWRWLFFLWAAMIGYAQIYVGVHYPLDIMVGAAVGLIVGYVTARGFEKQFVLE
jgi:membrane-associated phospholipid phosphatase